MIIINEHFLLILKNTYYELKIRKLARECKWVHLLDFEEALTQITRVPRKFLTLFLDFRVYLTLSLEKWRPCLVIMS